MSVMKCDPVVNGNATLLARQDPLRDRLCIQCHCSELKEEPRKPGNRSDRRSSGRWVGIYSRRAVDAPYFETLLPPTLHSSALSTFGKAVQVLVDPAYCDSSHIVADTASQATVPLFLMYV